MIQIYYKINPWKCILQDREYHHGYCGIYLDDKGGGGAYLEINFTWP